MFFAYANTKNICTIIAAQVQNKCSLSYLGFVNLYRRYPTESRSDLDTLISGNKLIPVTVNFITRTASVHPISNIPSF